MPSRRKFIVSAVGGLSAAAGCLGRESSIARCASEGRGAASQHLRRVAPLEGADQVSLGIVVSSEAVHQEQYHSIVVRDRDGELVASIPLADNRDMNRLTPDDFPILASEDGELYAAPLGPPPVHGEFTISVVTASGEPIATETIRFNCYSDDGSLP